MKEKQSDFIAWIKAHKKQLVFSGVSVVTIIGVIIGLKNKDAIVSLWKSLEKRIMNVPDYSPEPLNVDQATTLTSEDIIPVRPYSRPTKAFKVSSHIRNLSSGRRHSEEKEMEAAALGIKLKPNQTFVDGYVKCAS